MWIILAKKINFVRIIDNCVKYYNITETVIKGFLIYYMHLSIFQKKQLL